MKPGVTLDQVNAEFVALAKHLAEDNPKTNQNFTSASVQPLLNAFTFVGLRQTVWAMLAAVILVLLIACVNVMNMQFGRAALRAKELAIRGALGATRWRLVRQMLTESMVVAVFGAAAGVLLAYWSCRSCCSARLAHRRFRCLIGGTSRSTLASSRSRC